MHDPPTCGHMHDPPTCGHMHDPPTYGHMHDSPTCGDGDDVGPPSEPAPATGGGGIPASAPPSDSAPALQASGPQWWSSLLPGLVVLVVVASGLALVLVMPVVTVPGLLVVAMVSTLVQEEETAEVNVEEGWGAEDTGVVCGGAGGAECSDAHQAMLGPGLGLGPGSVSESGHVAVAACMLLGPSRGGREASRSSTACMGGREASRSSTACMGTWW